MYAVTDNYKDAIREAGLVTSARGLCAGVSFDDRNILQGSFTITGQCSDTDQVSIGQVYISELNITLRGLDVDRYAYKGSEIVPFFQVLTSEGIEEVPLGQFTISEAKNTSAGIVIRAYDHMARLDKSCSVSSTSGTLYQLAAMACNSCGLTLATTQAAFSTFANGSVTFSLYSDQNDIETWRDFISWVAQSCSCNVFANRNGQIEFRPYASGTVDTLNTYHRFMGAEFSDYETRYTGVYLQSIGDQTMEYYSVSPDDGLTYNLGKNPFFQYGLDATKESYCRAVLSALQAIRYVPFKIETVDDPAYDLMDVILMPDGLGDDTKKFCITKYTWAYHDKLTLEGVGSDPALASAKSKTQKELAGILSKTNEDAMCFYRFENSADLWIHDGSTVEIMRIDYVTRKDAHVDFRAEIKFTSETTETQNGNTYSENDTVIGITYIINDDVMEYLPLGTFVDDVFLEHLMYWWYASKNVIGTFIVKLTANGGDVKINTGDLNGLLYGIGLVGEEEDRNPVLTDDMPGLVFEPFGVFTDAATSARQTPIGPDTEDEVALLTFVEPFGAFTDSMGIAAGVLYTPYLSEEYINTTSVPIANNYWVASADGQYIQTINIYGATGFYSASGGALSYQMSIDDGATWGSWDGSSITPGDEMTYAIIHAIQTWPPKAMFKIIFDNAETLGGFMVEGGRVTQ